MAGKRLLSIDMLRGVAVLGVLVSHVPFSTAHTPAQGVEPLPGWVVELTTYGQFGVQLFLVISGFCIHMQWARQSEGRVSFIAFWRRRLHRLYPPYAAALALSLAGLFVLHGVLLGHPGQAWTEDFGYASGGQLLVDLVLLVLLAQNLNGAYLRVGNAPFWSLALEEQLYLLYFPLLWLRRRIGWVGALAVCAAVTTGWRAIGLYMRGAPDSWLYIGPALWLQCALGALAVESYLGKVVLPPWTRSAGVAVLCTAVAVALNHSYVGYAHIASKLVSDSAFGMSFFVWINFAAAREQRQAWGPIARALAHVGGWSYSLYLTHEPVIVAAKQIAVRAGIGAHGVLVARLGAALAAGYLFHVVVERRFMNAPAAVRGTASQPGTARGPLLNAPRLPEVAVARDDQGG
jgi:peptidoglycan/LPS O-acetylase OafA/YrhL